MGIIVKQNSIIVWFPIHAQGNKLKASVLNTKILNIPKQNYIACPNPLMKPTYFLRSPTIKHCIGTRSEINLITSIISCYFTIPFIWILNIPPKIRKKKGYGI